MHPVKAGEVVLGSKPGVTPPTNSTGAGLATPTGVEVGRLREKLARVKGAASWRMPSTKSCSCLERWEREVVWLC